MRLIGNCKEIRFLRRKLKLAVFLLNRRKRVCQKWKLTGYLGQGGLMRRTFKKIKRKNIFTQKNLQKKTFILKRMLILQCTNFTYNLCIFLKSKAEYLTLKQTMDFSGLNFDFWFLTKQWMLTLLKQNSQGHKLMHVFNGAMLVVRCNTVQELTAIFLAFNQPQTFCGGFFFQNRFFWPENFFDQLIRLDVKCKTTMYLVVKSVHNFFLKLMSFCLRVVEVLRCGSVAPFNAAGCLDLRVTEK